MKKSLVVVTTLLATLGACDFAPQNQYTVEGVLSDSSADGKTIYIMRYDDNAHIDSTVIADGKFAFRGRVDTAVLCRIDISRGEYANFILEKGNIRVNLEERNQPSGTPLNDELAAIVVSTDSLMEVISKKREEMQAQYSDESELLEQWQVYIKPVWEGVEARGEELYRKHNNDAVGEYLIRSEYNLQSNPAKWETILNSFGPWLKSRQTVQNMLVQLENLKKSAEGQPFIDVKGQGMDGKDAFLSDYVGKGNYVLVDFWASWCGPCKGEVPNLAKLHHQYKGKGFTVLGLFVWDEVENLKPTMEAEKMTWPQLIDSEKNATALYGVNGIPEIILFAPDGTILKRGLRGAAMIQTVNDLMQGK